MMLQTMLIRPILVAVKIDIMVVLAKTLFMAVLMMIIFGVKTEITNFMVMPVMIIFMVEQIMTNFTAELVEIISILKKAQIE